MAEFLIKAKGHWKDNWDQQKINSLTTEELDIYEMRSQKGDIIVVKPNGHTWGNAECPPNYSQLKQYRHG